MTKEERVVKLLESVEGIELQAYNCSAGVVTIGIGSTRTLQGLPIKLGDTITKQQAYDWLNDYLIKNIYPQVNKLQKLYRFNDDVWVALCSLAYNIGSALDPKESPKLHEALKSNNLSNIAVAFKRFNKVNGKVSKGLINRRATEIKEFLK